MNRDDWKKRKQGSYRSDQSDDIVKVKLAKSDDVVDVSLLHFRIASRNLSRDYLRRWWCKYYNIPPTDPRYGAYTKDALMVEYLENLIEDEYFELDKEKDPAIVTVDEYGIDTIETGIAEVDEDAKWLAEQRRLTMRDMKKRKERGDQPNILETLAELARQEKNA